MGLLDDLKRQAAQLQAHERAQARNFAESVLVVDDAMHRAFLYLNELVKQLNVLRPPCPRVFDIDPAVRFEGMRLNEFFIDFRKKQVQDRERYNHISLTWQHRSDQVITVRKELPQVIARFENNLRTAGAEFTTREIRNSRHMVTHTDFTIKCVLRATIRIEAEAETGTLRFRMRNVERVGSFDLVFTVDDITDPLLEDCARYILGESNQFRSVGRYVSPGPAGA
jgi:hypothetical protein